MVSELQKNTIQAIVNIFETGSCQGDYSRVTVASRDPGHLSYGRSQASLASGGLEKIITAYCESEGEYSAELKKFLPRMNAKDKTLDSDEKLKNLLERAGKDHRMRRVQDGFFDRNFWIPAVNAAVRLGASQALSLAVIYDSLIHGSWDRIKNRTNRKTGLSAVTGETIWIAGYLAARREWLANHSNTLLRRTVYRIDSLMKLMKEGRWELHLPLTVRGITISEKSFDPNEKPQRS